MALSDEIIAKISAADAFQNLSVVKIVAKELPTSDDANDASVGVVVSEPIPALAYGGERIYEEAQIVVNIFARAFARVESLTKALVKELDRFSGELTSIKVMQIRMTSQRYRADPEDEIEISQIIFDIKYT